MQFGRRVKIVEVFSGFGKIYLKREQGYGNYLCETGGMTYGIIYTTADPSALEFR